MIIDLAAEVTARLNTYPDHPAVNALRVLVEHEHIPGPDGLCLSCRWIHPCLTLTSIGLSLGVIGGEDIDGGLRRQWTRTPTSTRPEGA